MHLLKTIAFCILVATVYFVITSPMPTHAFSSYMDEHRGAAKQVKKFKKKNLIPTSMKCINPAKAGKFLKPEVTFKTSVNKDKRDWIVLAYKGQLNWAPDRKGYKKRYAKKLTAPNSGTAFHCSLWLGPKGSLGKMGSHKLRAFTN